MKIKEIIEDKIKIDYLLIEGSIKVDSNYFINEIDKGVNENNNKNFQTNVTGYMTSYHYFNDNQNFLKTIFPFFDYLDSLKTVKPYELDSSWGIKESFSHFTKEHTHLPNYISGIIYLNNHSQTLIFPEIKKELKPKKNSFVIFSSFLKHKAIRNISKTNKYALSFNLRYQGT